MVVVVFSGIEEMCLSVKNFEMFENVFVVEVCEDMLNFVLVVFEVVLEELKIVDVVLFDEIKMCVMVVMEFYMMCMDVLEEVGGFISIFV